MPRQYLDVDARFIRWSLLCTALVLCVIALGRGSARASDTAPPTLFGFQSDGAAPGLITRDAGVLGMVGVDGVNLTGRPGAVSLPEAADRAQLAAAHRAGRPAVLLVGNFSERIDDFSEPLAWRTLGSPAARERAAATLARVVAGEGFNGVSVDLESLRARDRTGLTAFVADLRADLGAAASLTVCVENLPTPAAYTANGYDLSGLAAAASQLVLMAYDEHGPWESTPGPVGATPWVRNGLSAMLHTVPAAQIDLGVAGYGYVWGPGARGRRQLSDAAAWALVRRAHGRARWVNRDGEWTARLSGGRVVWWSDARTRALRGQLASRLGLHGLALWSLGLAGPLTGRPAGA